MADHAVPSPKRSSLSIIRVFDAPRELVWKEWTEPSRFAAWFGGPHIDVPLSTVKLDLRPGGAWTATTRNFGAGRRDVRWRGRYLEVVEPERLTFTIGGLLSEEPTDVVEVSLADLGDERTEMVFVQQGQRIADHYDEARGQWLREFDWMDQRLANPATRIATEPG